MSSIIGVLIFIGLIVYIWQNFGTIIIYGFIIWFVYALFKNLYTSNKSNKKIEKNREIKPHKSSIEIIDEMVSSGKKKDANSIEEERKVHIDYKEPDYIKIDSVPKQNDEITDTLERPIFIDYNRKDIDDDCFSDSGEYLTRSELMEKDDAFNEEEGDIALEEEQFEFIEPEEVSYDYPSIELLDKPEKVTKEEYYSAEKLASVIVEMCESAYIDCKLIDISISEPFFMVKINLKRKGDYGRFLEGKYNFKYRLNANRIFISQMDENNNVNIIFSRRIEDLKLYSCLKEFKKEEDKILYSIGDDYECNKVFGDLIENRNLLIGGFTSSGKSNLIKTIATSMIFNYSPNEIQFTIISNNASDYYSFTEIPHFSNSIYKPYDYLTTELLRTVNGFKNKRISYLQRKKLLNIDEYNKNAKENGDRIIPHIVLIIDDLEDLCFSSKENLGLLHQIMLNGYYAGVHVIAVAESANKNSVPDTLLDKFNGRITFVTANAIQSRNIVGELGAEKMTNQGEIMYKTSPLSDVKAAITPFLTSHEINRVSSFLSHQLNKNVISEQFSKSYQLNGGSYEQTDALYDLAKEYVISMKKASLELIQKRFSINYSRAAKILTQLENNGVITKGKQNEIRRVYKPHDDIE